MFLVNVVFFSKEGNKGWKMSVLEHLFGSVVRESKYVKEGDMKAVVCNANEGLEYVTQYSVVKTEEHKEVLEGVFGEGLIGEVFEVLCGKFAQDVQYSKQLILFIHKISLLYLSPSLEETTPRPSISFSPSKLSSS